MFAAIRAAGAAAVADVIALPASEKDRESLRNQFAAAANGKMALVDAFNVFKGVDGTVTPRSSTGVNALMADGSVRFIRDSLNLQLRQALQLGVYGEKWESLPGATLQDVGEKTPESQQPVGFGMMYILNSAFVADPSSARSLAALPAQADDSFQRGDLAGMKTAMENYVALEKSLAQKPLPLISPIGEQTLSGWGSSMYQYSCCYY